MTDWLVYHCEECQQTTYVNLRLVHLFESPCGHDLKLIDLVDHHAMCDALRAVI